MTELDQHWSPAAVARYNRETFWRGVRCGASATVAAFWLVRLAWMVFVEVQP